MGETRFSIPEIVIFLVIAMIMIFIPFALAWLNSKLSVNIEDSDLRRATYEIAENLLSSGAASLPPTPSCTRTFSEHKAVDISAGCGTPVKALCDGFLETVYGVTQKVLNGGVVLDKLKNCNSPVDLSNERIFYACIKPAKEGSRNVEKGSIIGYVAPCDQEKDSGCHLHLQRVKRSINDQKDPDFVCNRLDSVLEKGRNILVEKEEISKNGGFLLEKLNELDGTPTEPLKSCYAYHVSVTSSQTLGDKKSWSFGFSGNEEFSADFPVYIYSNGIFPANFRLAVYDTKAERCGK